MDLHGFLRDGRPRWEKLERAIERLDAVPPKPIRPEEIFEFVALYRRATADLLWARRRAPNLELLDYLNTLVARGYATLYRAEPPPRNFGARALRFYRRDFPAAVRRHARAIAFAALLFAAGTVAGYGIARFDPPARFALIPVEHQLETPAERVQRDESSTPRREITADAAAAFSSFLFTHNIRVSLLAFALGMTFGIGTVLALLANGAMLGALAADYAASGESLFFWAWILPHGVLEIPSILIASAAGFLLARALLSGSAETRTADRLREAGVQALPLLAGCASLLVVAGLIEGSISQIHGMLLPEGVKLAFAAVVFTLLVGYLAFTGAGAPSPRDSG